MINIKKQPKLVMIIGVCIIAFSFLLRFVLLNKQGTVSIDTSATLTKALDIAELSTAEFKYRGIAEVYKDEEKTDIRCRICYNSIVKAGIDLTKVSLERDEDNKMIIVTLPPIEINVTLVDSQSMAILPSNTDISIESMLKYSREDAEDEARESEELMATARKNLEDTIEALLLPISKAQDYSISFK